MAASFPEAGMELTHILVVADIERARSFYRDVLGAEVVREYGGTSCVLRAFGTSLLLRPGGGPAAGTPTATFRPPAAREPVAPSTPAAAASRGASTARSRSTAGGPPSDSKFLFTKR